MWFRYSADRKGEHPARHLKSFTGILQADAYAGYNAIYEGGRIIEAGGDPRAATSQYRRAIDYDPGYAPPALALAKRAADKGLLLSVTADSVIRLVPPLIITVAEADEVVARLLPIIDTFLKEQG